MFNSERNKRMIKVSGWPPVLFCLHSCPLLIGMTAQCLADMAAQQIEVKIEAAKSA